MTGRAPLARVAVVAVATVLVAVSVATALQLRQSDAPILRYNPTALVVSAPPVVEASGSSRHTPRVDPTWIAQTARKTGIPAPAMRAYATAAARMAAVQPSCQLGWTTLAGIGYVESFNGEIGGSTLGRDGRSTPLILGPALNGAGDVAAIPATPTSAQWHGDNVWDHAVGPLQFLPSTWEQWGADGDRNGVADPNDIDDAAYAAARYLCADGLALDGPQWSTAVLSYNHSNAYVRLVFNAASAYAARAS